MPKADLCRSRFDGEEEIWELLEKSQTLLWAYFLPLGSMAYYWTNAKSVSHCELSAVNSRVASSCMAIPLSYQDIALVAVSFLGALAGLARFIYTLNYFRQAL